MSARADDLARLRDFAERRLPSAEFEAWIRAPWDARDLAEAEDLIRWHLRRYPTPAARLRHAREAYARWVRDSPPPPRREPVDDGFVTLELE